nr:MAG TPA: hypothetical protein [Caudoviricetes sp.]
MSSHLRFVIVVATQPPSYPPTIRSCIQCLTPTSVTSARVPSVGVAPT